jgi:hypothetical protein
VKADLGTEDIANHARIGNLDRVCSAEQLEIAF